MPTELASAVLGLPAEIARLELLPVIVIYTSELEA